MIRITKNVEEAKLITHDGRFHADEVMATAILSRIFKDAVVCRVSELPEKKPEDAIVYDIGDGEFDHHQSHSKKMRFNGVAYSSCGLIWKAYGKEIVKNTSNPKLAFENIDKRLIMGIDASDSRTSIYSEKKDVKSMNIAEAVAMFNPTWNSLEDSDEAFLRAVNFAGEIFDNTLNNAIGKIEAKPLIEEAIEKSSNHIMVLEKFIPWQQHLFESHNIKAQTIWFTIFPSKRGGYNWETVTLDLNTKRLRKDVPYEWKGKSGEKIKKLTGVPTAAFCHLNGHIGGAETLEGAIQMLEKIIK